MGLSFSTKNFEKIINVLEKPYMKNLYDINNNLFNAANIDNENRRLVYKHRTTNIYIFYAGGICDVSQCCEVNENLLLINGIQFSNFYALKDYIIKNYPHTEILLEIVKYESQNYITIIDKLERGELFEDDYYSIHFSDDESTGDESSEEECIKNTTKLPLDDFCVNFGKNYYLEINSKPDLNIYDKEWNIEWVYNSNNEINSWDVPTIWNINNNIFQSNNNNDITDVLDKAIETTILASTYAEKKANEVKNYLYQNNSLDVVEEDFQSDWDDWSDWSELSDDEIILPNLNYLKSKN